jgi:hypothetical protein
MSWFLGILIGYALAWLTLWVVAYRRAQRKRPKSSL